LKVSKKRKEGIKAKAAFVLLCWRAYNGDVEAGLEAIRILRRKVKTL
jgi:hypothetical protein